MRRTIPFVVLALVLAPPAFGGPSALSIAKRALKIAHDGPRISYAVGGATATRGGFTRFTVECPQGYAAVSIQQNVGALELVYSGLYGRGALVSMFNPSRTASHFGGTQITCIRGQLDSPPNPIPLTHELAAAESDRRALLSDE